MNYLSVEGLCMSFADKMLFQNVNFGVQKGDKIAIVGNNGAGKSTLLKILSSIYSPDKGEKRFRKDIEVAHLLQTPEFVENHTVWDALFSTNNATAQIVKEYIILTKAMEDGDESIDITSVLEKMEETNAWNFEAKVMQIASKLGLNDFDKFINTMSGGEKKRVALAQLLLSEADFLILDEPTNHLDIVAIEWLEKYLSSENMTLMMVTHDRYFLDSVSSKILELDRQSIYEHKGNYANFLENRATRYDIESIEVSKARQLYKKELEWMRRQPKARGTKSQSRINQFDDIKKVAKKNINKDELLLNVEIQRQGKSVIEVTHLEKYFDNKRIFTDFSYTFKRQERIGIVGPNGAGKSTFLNILTENLAPDKGKIKKGFTTQIGYFTQNTDNYKPNNRVIDEVKDIAEYIQMSDGKKLTASKLLEHFLFEPKKQYDYVRKLSGGELKRLQLLKVMIKNPNFLILDEPTNDLDGDTLNVLEQFLREYTGCLLLVSHDRYFMDQLVDTLFVFENQNISIFNGNYTDYLLYREESLIEQRNTNKINKTNKKKNKNSEPISTSSQELEIKSKSKSNTNTNTKLSYKEKIEYDNMEEEIGNLEEEKSVLEKKIVEQLGNHEEINAYASLLAEIEKKIEFKMERWIELEKRL